MQFHTHQQETYIRGGIIKIGLVGGSYQQRSLPFDAQRSVNLYPILDEQGAEVASMQGTAGLSSFASTGSGGIRGGFRSANGRVFFVSGSTLYETLSDGSSVSHGSLATSEGNISIDEDLNTLAICDGTKLYSFTYASDTFATVTASGLPSSVGFVTNIDGYFVVNENDSGRFFISAINDITSWNALDFATAESKPDLLLCAKAAVGQLWLFGRKTTEIWTNTGASTFPFARISGAIMEVGILAPHSVQDIDNSIIWIGQDEFGDGIVYRATGFSPQRISTSPIERIIQSATSKEDIVSWAYQEDGHVFVVFTGGGLPTSLVYDLTTGFWHERAYLNTNGDFEQHLGYCHVFAFGKNLVGDRRNGTIYDMSLDYYSDNGDEIARERIYTHVIDESRRIRYNSLEIGFETGVGLQSGQGSDPQVSLQLSQDGARTWSNWITKTIGKVGKYQTKIVFRRLGISEILTFKVRISDPVKVNITGSYLF